MIVQVIHYKVVCDKCGAMFPLLFDPDAAHDGTLEVELAGDGWKVDKGQVKKSTHLCHQCRPDPPILEPQPPPIPGMAIKISQELYDRIQASFAELDALQEEDIP